MREAAQLFVGFHDFSNFQIIDKKIFPKTIIYNIEVWFENGFIFMKFVGKGFRNKMIRKIVWTLTQVGQGKLDVNYVKKLINVEVRETVPSAPPEGLYLVKVDYGNKIRFKISKRAIEEILTYLKTRLSAVENYLMTLREMNLFFTKLKIDIPEFVNL